MPRATHGTVKLKLGDRTFVMKPTLEAYDIIEERLGGMRQAMESTANMSLEAQSIIVGVACNLSSKERKEVKQLLFDEGTINSMPAITEFLMKMLNPSGKEPEAQEDKDPPGET